MMSSEEFLKAISAYGSAIIPDVLTPDFIVRAKSALVHAIATEDRYHRNRQHKDHGMVLLCALYGRVFIDLLANAKLTERFNQVLGPGCIVYAYTSSSMPPKAGNYSTRIHVDCPRHIPGYVTNMGATILLDDFTVENGATWFLPCSHLKPEPPHEETFYRDAKRVIAPAGSVWFFNARVWHAGGQNSTDEWRHALTINMCRPYMKQRIDIPRAMEAAGIDLKDIAPEAMQKLGFFAQVPANYDEYYAPPEQRKYRQPVE